MRKILSLLIGTLLFSGCLLFQDEEKDDGGGGSGTPTNVDLFHGYYDVGPTYHFRLKFKARQGDTLHFEARVRAGDGDISYAFWADSLNYAMWLMGDTATLHDYREAEVTVSYQPVLDSGTYYVVLGNSSLVATKRYWVRAYLRGLR
ncbi:MAG: hypothetical protein GXO39_03610 [Thermotogae bacterium]|nr:hypothetical protein [Thermotogota bacterium]